MGKFRRIHIFVIYIEKKIDKISCNFTSYYKEFLSNYKFNLNYLSFMISYTKMDMDPLQCNALQFRESQRKRNINGAHIFL